MKGHHLSFIDLFCGAGGFSEGLRLAGLEPKLGIDNWDPAIVTYAKNQKAETLKLDIELLALDTEAVEKLPLTDLIVGSPPCVSFSNSNKSGYADKSLGIRLTNAFFRIVAIKKYQKGSILKGWVMENVPKALPYLPETYSFKDLGLSKWAKKRQINSQAIAISLKEKSTILDSSIYGAPQKRKRLFIVDFEGSRVGFENLRTRPQKTLAEVLESLPKPSLKRMYGDVIDCNYPSLSLKKSELSDHFYDTGIPFRYWKESKFLKTNHPYMGRMSFPENGNAPARTVCASPFSTSRESMIFKCESGRTGDGEYRSPTVREAATIMTFPISYQFYGTEPQKWKLVGNAVCPSTAACVAKQILKCAGLRSTRKARFRRAPYLPDWENLNRRPNKKLSLTVPRRPRARFRRHTFKTGNMTVALSNYDMLNPKHECWHWGVFATYGISTSHEIEKIEPSSIKKIRKFLESEIGRTGEATLQSIDFHIKKYVPQTMNELQEKYENGDDFRDSSNPITIVENLREEIDKKVNGKLVDVSELPNFKKQIVPLKQVVTAYAFLKAVGKLKKGNYR